jgi:hypothetical protein
LAGGARVQINGAADAATVSAVITALQAGGGDGRSPEWSAGVAGESAVKKF